MEPGMVAVEWSERLPYRPADYLQIILSHTPQGDRQIKLIPMGELVIELDGLIDPV